MTFAFTDQQMAARLSSSTTFRKCKNVFDRRRLFGKSHTPPKYNKVVACCWECCRSIYSHVFALVNHAHACVSHIISVTNIFLYTFIPVDRLQTEGSNVQFRVCRSTCQCRPQSSKSASKLLIFDPVYCCNFVGVKITEKG